MGIEIERKYLVDTERWAGVEKGEGVLYQQGYIVNQPDRTVRVRVGNSGGYLTIKGGTKGISRDEYEYSIPQEDAVTMLQQFCTTTIEKLRYLVKHDGKIWEVDEFSGANAGLIVAEIELGTEDELFALPEWVTKEVTEDARYYNAALVTHPYKSWKIQ